MKVSQGSDLTVAGKGFDSLYQKHYQRLVRLAMAVLAEDTATAEDLAQEAFARLLTARSVSDPGAYLSATVVNLARSKIRRAAIGRRKRRAGAEHAPPADSGAERIGLRSQVLAALAQLPARQREAVALRYYQGLTDQQVAEAMGISPGSVKTHLHRAVSALAHDLEAFR